MIKDFLKKIISKIGIGFCYGIGICFAVLAFYYTYESIDFKEDEDEKYEYAEEGDIHKLKIEDLKVVPTEENRFELIGTITNSSDFDWTSIKFEIELYDENGKFVYECTDRLSNTIKPFQSEHFKTVCGKCLTIPKYSDYKIKIVKAHGHKEIK